MSRASWLSGAAAPGPRRPAPAPVTVAPEPEPPPAVAEPVTPLPATHPVPPADLAARLTLALELLEAPLPPPVPGAATYRRRNQVGHALDQARAALRRAVELARPPRG